MKQWLSFWAAAFSARCLSYRSSTVTGVSGLVGPEIQEYREAKKLLQHKRAHIHAHKHTQTHRGTEGREEAGTEGGREEGREVGKRSEKEEGSERTTM